MKFSLELEEKLYVGNLMKRFAMLAKLARPARRYMTKVANKFFTDSQVNLKPKEKELVIRTLILQEKFIQDARPSVPETDTEKLEHLNKGEQVLKTVLEKLNGAA